MKVAIIGAGTCGLYLGWRLAEKGHKVVIFERKGKIGNEVCSGLFSQRILKFIPQSKEQIQNQINFALLHFPGKTVKLKFSKKFLVMSHYKLDELVASLAQEAGAEIVLNNKISSLPEGFDRIIGCDGANSFVRKELKLPDVAFRLGIQGFIKEKCSLDFVEVWPCLNGFIWKIPRGNEIEYGIVSDFSSASSLFQSFLKKNNLLLERTKSRIIPQGLIISSNSQITLCGDSVGLTKPWSGGGVIWGLSAAGILLKTFPDFRRFGKKLKRFFLPKIILSKLAVKIVYFLGFRVPWLLPKTAKMESDFLL